MKSMNSIAQKSQECNTYFTNKHECYKYFFSRQRELCNVYRALPARIKGFDAHIRSALDDLDPDHHAIHGAFESTPDCLPDSKGTIGYLEHLAHVAGYKNDTRPTKPCSISWCVKSIRHSTNQICTAVLVPGLFRALLPNADDEHAALPGLTTRTDSGIIPTARHSSVAQ